MDMPTFVETPASCGMTTRIQPWRGCLANNIGDVVAKGEVYNPWEVTGRKDASERGSVTELFANVSAVTLDAAKQKRSRDWGFVGPTCVGTLERTGFKAFVRDVVDHVNKVCNCG